MKLLKLTILTATVAAVATAAAITAYRDVPTYAEPNIDTAYTCASIHFGMDDSTLTGYVCSASVGTNISKGAENSSLVSQFAKGVGIESFIVSSDSSSRGKLLTEGKEYTFGGVKNSAINNHGLKLGGASGKSTLTIVLSSTAIGCDIYAVGYSDANITLSVNDSEEISIPTNESITDDTQPDTLSVTYSKYTFAFDASDTITIVTAKRAIIGDIAIRLS